MSFEFGMRAGEHTSAQMWERGEKKERRNVKRGVINVDGGVKVKAFCLSTPAGGLASRWHCCR